MRPCWLQSENIGSETCLLVFWVSARQAQQRSCSQLSIVSENCADTKLCCEREIAVRAGLAHDEYYRDLLICIDVVLHVSQTTFAFGASVWCSAR